MPTGLGSPGGVLLLGSWLKAASPPPPRSPGPQEAGWVVRAPPPCLGSCLEPPGSAQFLPFLPLASARSAHPLVSPKPPVPNDTYRAILRLSVLQELSAPLSFPSPAQVALTLSPDVLCSLGIWARAGFHPVLGRAYCLALFSSLGPPVISPVSLRTLVSLKQESALGGRPSSGVPVSCSRMRCFVRGPRGGGTSPRGKRQSRRQAGGEVFGAEAQLCVPTISPQTGICGDFTLFFLLFCTFPIV